MHYSFDEAITDNEAAYLYQHVASGLFNKLRMRRNNHNTYYPGFGE